MEEKRPRNMGIRAWVKEVTLEGTESTKKQRKN